MQTRTGIVVLLLGASSIAAARAPGPDRERIVDPARLERLGQPRGATNVYELSPKPSEASQSTETWGTAVGYSTAMGYELTRENGFYLQKELGRTFCPNESAAGISQAGIAQFQLPDGARIEGMEIWAFDSDPDYFLTFDLLEFCQDVGFNGPTITGLATAMTTGSAGRAHISAAVPGFTVNNRDCGYSVRVVFAPATLPCRFDKLQLEKLALRWSRQVSPPPASATFTDVPLDHPFSQYVEALVKSGITGGCGGGNFCPDNPLTRGQMAVFLAKGLGLSWP